MKNDWIEAYLGDVAEDMTVGFVGSMAQHYSEKGVPFLRSQDILPYKINLSDIKYISEEFNETIKKSALFSGDVVVVRTGKPGTAAVVPDGVGKLNCSDLVIIRPGKNLSSKYLCYYINTVARNHISAHLVGAVQQHFNVGSAKQMKLDLPPLPVQHQIAAILSALDDKIELNRQMNRTLEQMARALFKSWFIDFDPVHAKQRGEQPAGMDAETAALFPDRFVEIDGKELPEGWAYGSVSDIAQQVKNQMNPSDHPDALFAHFSIPAFDASGRPAIERGSEIKSNKFVVPDAAILVSKLNPATPRIWDTDLSDDAEYRVSSTEFIPLVTHSGELRAFLYLALTSHDFAKALSGQASGTSNSHQRVKPSDILSAPVLLAPPQVIAAFGRLVIPILDHAKRNLREINQLAGTRDSLLPRLLSGELDVSDWENAVEDPESSPA